MKVILFLLLVFTLSACDFFDQDLEGLTPRDNTREVRTDDISITLPSTPIVVNRYFADNLRHSVIITDIDYQVRSRVNDNIAITLIVSGQKTFNRDGSGTSEMVTFVVRLLDESNNVLKTSRVFLPSIMEGDQFADVETPILGVAPGNYTIEIIQEQ